MSKFHHSYSCVVCPGCAADLTAKGAVTIEGASNSGATLGMFQTSLTKAGDLLPDDDGVLAAGQHAGTLCTACCEPLDHLEKLP